MDYPSGPVGSPRRYPQPNKPVSHNFPPAPSATSSVPMVVIVTVVGILSAFVLLASYCAFVTKCQLLRLLLSRARHGALGEAPPSSSSVIVRDGAASDEQRGLGLPLIRMLPVVEFTAAAQGRKKLSVSSECGVCLSEFEERERVRLLPACAHAFHVDCIDTWLQGSARCPFCRASVTLLPPLPPPQQQPSSPNLAAIGNGSDRDSIVVEVRGEQESWPGRAASGRKARKKKESVGDEAVDTRSRKEEEEFAVQPVRRSLSCGDRLCVSVVRELLAAGQRQVCDQ